MLGAAAMKKESDLKPRILTLMRAPKYRPLDKIEFTRALGMKSDHRGALKQALRDLERAGDIARIRKNRYVLPAEADLVTGKLQIHQSGFGFLVRENSTEGDIFISAENTGTAMNGDRVVARITRDAAYTRARSGSSRPEGRVIRILERAHATIVGTLQQTRNFSYVVPDDPRMVHNVYTRPQPLPGAKRAPAPGDKVVVRLEAWESRHVNPEGEIVEVLGRATDPGVDMLSIIRKHHLPTEFPENVLAEAERVPESVDPNGYGPREDLRARFIVTIDPDDARDFDDAIHVEKLPGGDWELGVHIADVSAYVTPGSALDREALQRGNSVYLADRVIPMLPERLSNGVCSLNPHVVRLTHSAFIRFAKNGAPKSARFGRTIIQSAHRLTYKEAYAILQKPPNDKLSERLHTAWSLASILRKRRFANGSLDLDFPEVKVIVDRKTGKPLRLDRIENDESHQLVEEFMLAANEAVALELKNRLVPDDLSRPRTAGSGEARGISGTGLELRLPGWRPDESPRIAAADRALSREAGRAGAENRTSEKSQARPLCHAATRPFRSREEQLHALHQPDSAIRRSGRTPQLGRPRREEERSSWRERIERHRRAHLDDGTRRRRG